MSATDGDNAVPWSWILLFLVLALASTYLAVTFVGGSIFA